MSGKDDTGLVYSRSYQTKMSIAQAFNELCEDEPFQKIRIDTIAQKAGVSRSSFYHHFTDKNDVIRWLSMLFYEKGLDETGRSLTWFEGHMVTTRGFRTFSTLLTSAAECTEYGGGQPFYVRHRQAVLTETITEYRNLALTERLKFQIEALPYSEMIMANNFEVGKYSYSMKEYCEFMVSLVPKDLFEALEHPVDPKPFHDDYLGSPWT